MFEQFQRSECEVNGVRIAYRKGGSGPPLLLLHGYPQTHFMWHQVADQLAERFTVVAADLRGYGDSEKPPGGDDHSAYSFRAMAQDQVEVPMEVPVEVPARRARTLAVRWLRCLSSRVPALKTSVSGLSAIASAPW